MISIEFTLCLRLVTCTFLFEEFAIRNDHLRNLMTVLLSCKFTFWIWFWLKHLCQVSNPDEISITKYMSQLVTHFNYSELILYVTTRASAEVYGKLIWSILAYLPLNGIIASRSYLDWFSIPFPFSWGRSRNVMFILLIRYQHK